jgi:glyoxylate/hydroxypyruvate reductase
LTQVGFGVRRWNRSGGPLHDALRDAEIVVNALPLTPHTRGLLDADAFACMPRGAYLINVARGAHVVEPDLIAAVRGGQLAGAALDVQDREPLPTDDALWAVPGITITPHIAAQPSARTIAAQFVAGRRRLLAGELPANLVDRARGY